MQQDRKHDNKVADCVVMIRPTDFASDEQTATDNIFQQKVDLPQEEILKRANKEWDAYVALLREKGIKVIAIDKNLIPELKDVQIPDGIFPNWFTTEPNGTLVVYKMHTDIREDEKKLLRYLERAFYDEGYHFSTILSIGCPYDPKECCLEGTGAVVFDRHNKVVFSGKSQRSNSAYLEKLCIALGYRAVNFETAMSNGEPFYHTDLYMCIGLEYVVVCLEAIQGGMRAKVKQEFELLGKEIIEISLEQVEKYFCGNLHELRSQKDGKSYLIMSKKAYSGFTEKQLNQISKYSEILSVDLETIEAVGGGSAKCCMASCWLPQNPKKKPVNAYAHPIKESLDSPSTDALSHTRPVRG